jgi:5'-deoxynucleotidase YfbR-like HD superfamily hydrolase
MTYEPKSSEVETSSGRYVDLLNPEPETIALDDIAHALSQNCRYNGHTSRFDSVAEHAVFVSKRLERKRYDIETQLLGLHHDDHEAYLGDIVRPLKALLGDSFTALADKMDDAIWASLNLPEFTIERHRFVKDADNWALFVEALHLLPSKGAGWRVGRKDWDLDSGVPKRIVTPNDYKGGIKPRTAELNYLKRHSELVSRLSK